MERSALTNTDSISSQKTHLINRNEVESAAAISGCFKTFLNGRLLPVAKIIKLCYLVSIEAHGSAG